MPRRGSFDVRVVPFQIVHIEEAAVEKRDPAEQFVQFRLSLVRRLTESLVEQPQQERAVEVLETAFCPCRPQPVQVGYGDSRDPSFRNRSAFG